MKETCFFSSGVSPAESNQISSSTYFTHASLPVRYFDVPLCTKKLNLVNCQTLIQRIKRRLSTLTMRSLSFAGRKQLLSLVISGITNFGTSSFVLPKRCIEQINFLCSEFFWKGTVGVQNSARVVWGTFTLSKDEGGLGMRDLLKWNKACIIKLFGILFFRPNSIWANWFTREVLDGDLNNYWVINTKTEAKLVLVL